MSIYSLTILPCVTKPQPNHIRSWWLISNSDSMKKVFIHHLFSIFYFFELFDQTSTNLIHFIYLQDCPWLRHRNCYILTSILRFLDWMNKLEEIFHVFHTWDTNRWSSPILRLSIVWEAWAHSQAIHTVDSKSNARLNEAYVKITRSPFHFK